MRIQSVPSLGWFIFCSALFLTPLELVGSIGFEGNLLAESGEALSLMKDELQNLRIDLTKSFGAEHTIRKRNALGFTYEANIAQDHPTVVSKLGSSGATSCTFKGEILVFKQTTGIYKVDSSSHALVHISDWTFQHDDEILNTYEWDDKLFILTTNKNGSDSWLYTLRDSDYIPVPRQKIRNHGFASAAQFFQHSRDLYLVIAVDNIFHSLTISPIYRWFKTYMDQIHEIHTRGASAVLAFSINTFEYIAIAQNQDDAGNYEVGTLVVRMFERGQLEKVQLLWSNEPIALSHVRILQEEYLVIGQRRESSIVYWFGGYDFIFWQSLDDFMGKRLFLDSLVLPDNEPLLVAANEREVRFYGRSSSTRSMTPDLVLNFSLVAYSTGFTETLVNFQLLRKSSEISYLAMTIATQQFLTAAELKFFEIKLTKKDIGKSTTPDSHDKLSLCLTDLRSRLDHDEPDLTKLENDLDKVLTRNKDAAFEGSIVVSQNAIVLQSETTAIDYVSVTPELTHKDKYTLTPSEILRMANREVGEFDRSVQPNLETVLLKSVAGNITGDKTFLKSLVVTNLHSSTELRLQVLNEVPWSDLENKMLRTPSNTAQVISGDWTLQTLTTKNFQGGDYVGNISIDDFLLTSCDSAQTPQIVQAIYNFNNDVHFRPELALGRLAKINSILFSDIALRSQLPLEVRGYKHADFVNGDAGFEAFLLNGLNLEKWYNAMLKIDGDDQYSTGLKTFSDLRSASHIEVENLNGRDWNEFLGSVLISGLDQTIQGSVTTQNLETIRVNVDYINGKSVNDLLTTNTNQVITSNISIGSLFLKRNVETGTVNGDLIGDAILVDGNAIIQGPLELSGFNVNDIIVEDKITISGIDVSEAAKLPKTHIYSTADREALYIDTGDFKAIELISPSLNGISFHRILDAYWSTQRQNVIPEDFDFSAAGNVEITGTFWTGTMNGLRLEKDVVKTKGSKQIQSNLQFERAVFAEDDVLCPKYVTLNDIDFSELAKLIIRTTDPGRRKITGVKFFQDPIVVDDGIAVGRVNNISLEYDVVLLASVRRQQIDGNKKFHNANVRDVWSRTNVSVNGLVNGQNLKHVWETTAYHGRQVRIEGDVIFEQSIEAKDLWVNKEFNQKPFAQIVAYTIDLSLPQTLKIPLVILGTLTFRDNADVASLNGINVAEYLQKVVDKYSAEVIKGIKVFENLTVDGNLDSCVSVNGIDLPLLEKTSFSKSAAQTVKGNMQFFELHIKNNLKTTNSHLDGIPLASLSQTDEDFTIRPDVEFESSETRFDNNIRLEGLLNGYDIEKVAEGLKTLHGTRKFNTLTVQCNLSWDNSKLELLRLSHLFEDSVTVDSDQSLTGKIIFAYDLTVDSIKTTAWINGVDLEALKQDGVFQYKPVEFTGRNTFINELRVSRGPVEVKHKLDANFINSISLKTLSQQVVRINSANRLIHGMKTFEDGLIVESIFAAGSIDNVYPGDLVLAGDGRTIDQITIPDARIKYDLNFDRLKGDLLKDILNERVSLSEAQTIFGNFEFQDDVRVEECSANPINGIYASDLFDENSGSLQEIVGRKTFSKLRIEGNVTGISINGIFLDQLNDEIFRLDEDEIFRRHVVFADTVVVSHINVTDKINKIDLDKFHSEYYSQLKEIVDPVKVSEQTKETALLAIEKLGLSTQDQAFWFDEHLVPVQYLNVGPRSRVEYFIPQSKSFVTIALSQTVSAEESQNKCNLPPECFCNSIQFVQLHKNNSTATIGDLVFGATIFDLLAPSGSAFTVYSHSVSYDKKCSSAKENGFTHISRMVISERPERSIVQGNLEDKYQFPATSLLQIKTGYLTDAKIFSQDGKDYIVMAQFYNFTSQSHTADVLVFEIVGENIREIQAIPASGAIRLALEKVDNFWILGIANSLPETSLDCPTGSKIYRWSREKGEFVLLRTVDTVGAVDLIILNVPKDKQFHDSLIVFAENDEDVEENKRLGKVSIYGFERSEDGETPSYSIFQTLEFDTPISAIYGISVRKQAYLFVVTNSKILFYKYLHFEGFIKSGSVEINGAVDTNVITWKNRLMFIVASTKVSLLAEAAIFGSLGEHSYQIPKH